MAREDRNCEPVQASAADLAALLDRLCPGSTIDMAGALALPCKLPHADRWFDWLAAERHAGLEYLTRDPAGRADPTLKNPWSRSVLIFAQRYTAGWPAGDLAPASGGPAGNADDPHWTARVARYARGLDYHDVFLKDIKTVLKGLQDAFGGLKAFAAHRCQLDPAGLALAFVTTIQDLPQGVFVQLPRLGRAHDSADRLPGEAAHATDGSDEDELFPERHVDVRRQHGLDPAPG